MQYYFIRSIEALVTPPGIMFMMILAGFAVGRPWPRAGRNLVLAGLVLLFIASLPVTSLLVYRLLESDPPLSEHILEDSPAQAIVILGGGRYPGFEYHKETVSLPSLERLRYGAWLHQLTGLPILVTGGSVKGEIVSEARLMAQTLTATLGARPEWVEGKSVNTWENAKFSWQILQKHNIKHILLVTHAGHMQRAKISFIQQGFHITAAPLGFRSKSHLGLLHFLPSGHALSDLQAAAHELVGRLWYALRY